MISFNERLVIDGGTVLAEASAAGYVRCSYGVQCWDDAAVELRDGALTASGGTCAVSGSITTAVAGKGCATVDGTGEWSAVATGSGAQNLTYKLVCLPAVSVRNGVVTAPANARLIVASYDAQGRMQTVKTFTAPAKGWTGVPVAEIARGADFALPNAYRLMLVDASTFAPLCEAWSKS